MTKRHPMACHDPSSWSFGAKKETFSSLGQKERLRDPKETLIKSQSQILQEFLYIASSYPSLNSSIFASGYSSLCIKIQE